MGDGPPRRWRAPRWCAVSLAVLLAASCGGGDGGSAPGGSEPAADGSVPAPGTAVPTEPTEDTGLTQDAEGTEGQAPPLLEGGPVSPEVAAFVSEMAPRLASADLCTLYEVSIELELPVAATTADRDSIGTFVADYLDAVATTSPPALADGASDLRAAAQRLREQVGTGVPSAVDDALADAAVGDALFGFGTEAADTCVAD